MNQFNTHLRNNSRYIEQWLQYSGRSARFHEYLATEIPIAFPTKFNTPITGRVQ